MPTRHNLALVPALKIDASTWFGPGGGDWARTASAHASLCRDTAWAGTTAGNIAASRATIAAGDWVVGSVEVYAAAPSTFTCNIDWYASGNVFLDSSDGPDYNLTGGTTRRVTTGVGQAPANAVRATVTLNGLDGSTQVTALMIEKFATEAEAIAAVAVHETVAGYFDGDGTGTGVTDGASWDGADGESPSTLVYEVSPVLTASLPRLVGSLTAQRTMLGAELTAELGTLQGAIGLFVTVSYDDRRGRIRIKATGMHPSVLRATVESRPATGSRWSPVRGGSVAVVDGTFSRVVDDYEFVAGAGMYYRIKGLSSPENTADVVVQTRIVQVEETLDQVWLKFISTPYRNRKVILHDWSPVSRKARVALYEVAGRTQPVAVTDVHTGRTMSIKLVCHTMAERDALDAALETGVPVYFQTPVTTACPTMYAVVGDYSYDRPRPRSLRSVFTIDLIEVTAPPASVVGVGLTYAVLAEQYGTYADLSEGVTTYAEVQS